MTNIMLGKPWDPSPCCRDRDGKLLGTHPTTQHRTWDPITKTGKLYCSVCHREFDVHSSTSVP
jgi:uncharacterized protein YbaR (Trm112 family)